MSHLPPDIRTKLMLLEYWQFVKLLEALEMDQTGPYSAHQSPGDRLFAFEKQWGLTEPTEAMAEFLRISIQSIVKGEHPSRRSGKPLPPKAKKILVLAATARSEASLDTDSEIRAIQRAATGHYEVISVAALAAGDLSKHLAEHQDLSILHFCCHGDSSGQLLVDEDERLLTKAFDFKALHQRLAGLKIKPECLIFNSCHSAIMAREAAKEYPVVVAYQGAVTDASATIYSRGFYSGMAQSSSGVDYTVCHVLGLTELSEAAEVPAAQSPDLYLNGRLWSSPKNGSQPRSSAVRGKGGASDSETTEINNHTFRVWFGTNRNKIGTAISLGKTFGELLGDEVIYGLCDVHLPKGSEAVSLIPGWLRNLFRSSGDRLALTNLECLSKDSFKAALHTQWESVTDGERMALCFIHGFHVSFEDAAFRSAQIGFDLRVPTVGFFSWPAPKGFDPRTYLESGDLSEASENEFLQFLETFATSCSADKICIMAHSMGNRILARSLQSIIEMANQRLGRQMFFQSWFVAPDIDSTTFERQCVDPTTGLARHALVAHRSVLFINPADKALAASRFLRRGRPRAGISPPVTILPQMETVQVQNVDLDWLGHGYYAASRDFLRSLNELLFRNTEPQLRQFYAPAQTDFGERYWKIN